MLRLLASAFRWIARRQIARDAPLAVKLPMTPEFRRALIVDAESTVLRRVLANASAVEAQLGDLAAGETEQASLVRRKHLADMKVYENRLERWQVRHDFPIAARTPSTSRSARLDTLAAELPALEKAAADAAKRLDSMAFMVGMARRRLDAALVNLTGGHGAIESTLEAIDERIANERRATSEYVLSSVRRQLALALWILLGIIATPVLIKLFFYYLVAPWVARLPPIRLLPGGRDAWRSREWSGRAPARCDDGRRELADLSERQRRVAAPRRVPAKLGRRYKQEHLLAT